MAAREAQHEFRAILLKLIELWYGTTSTVLLTQLKKRGWQPRLGGGAHADTIMDRIVQGVAPKLPGSDFAHALEHEVCGTPLPCDFLEDLSKRANETRVEVGGDEPHARCSTWADYPEEGHSRVVRHTTQSESTQARQHEGAPQGRPLAIKRHRGPCRPRCQKEYQQCCFAIFSGA